MIQIFAPTATTFTTNGLAILTPIKAEIVEQINGEFALKATFSEADSVLIIEDRILYAYTPATKSRAAGKQPYRIREIEAVLDGVEVYAPHIFYDLADYFIEDTYPTADTGQEAITAILGATTEASGFTGYSDITTTQNARYVMRSPVSCLLDASEDNCFINRWGGEIERDGKTVRMLTSLGVNNGVQIRYRKNLTGLKCRTDMSTVKTRILPTGLNADDTLLEGAYVDSAYIASYAHPKVGRAHFPDVKVGIEVDGAVPYPDSAAALAKLATRAAALYAAGLDVPTITLDVEFVDLSRTEEYAQYASLESVSLGDTVRVIHEPLNVDVSLRVVEYTYDPETQMYTRLTIGALPPNIGTSVIGQGIDISAIKDDLEQGVLRRGEKYNEVAINHADGFVSTATIEGIELKTRMNGTNGFELLADDVVVGAFTVVNGKARLITDTIGEMSNIDKVYISMEPDPDSLADAVLRFFRYDTGTSAWYEGARMLLWNNSFRIAAYPDPDSDAGAAVIYAKGEGTRYSQMSVYGGISSSSPLVTWLVSDGTGNQSQLQMSLTALTLTRNGTPIWTQ